MKIPFLSFEETNKLIKSDILESFEKFFDNAWYVLGNQVEEFEKNYAAFNNVDFCIGISNGLDALHISLQTLGIGEGDEVIVPSNTFIATVLAISYVGATPVFVEPNIQTYNIDPSKIEQAITPRTKAIMPVHLYGQACEMTPIMKIANHYKLFVIEDNAQSQGATYEGRLTGSFGDINATSFYPGKNLGALGDAGGITTNSSHLAELATTFRNYGSKIKYENDLVGFNMRLDEVQAGFLSVKLRYLKKWTSQRQQIAEWYLEALDGCNNIVLPLIAEGASHVYHLFVIRTASRNELQMYLNSVGIGSLIHYPIPPHLQKAYKSLGFQRGDFPISEEIADTCLSLPIWPGLKKEEVFTVSSHIRSFLDR